MKRLHNNIDKQINSNRGKNLFCGNLNESLKFIPGTVDAINNLGNIDEDSANMLIDYVTNRALEEFCRVNQYYSIQHEAKQHLRNIYAELFSNIKNKEMPVGSISEKHYNNLKKWLQESNPFAEKIYSSKGELVEPVLCAEYSPELQLEILRIDTTHLKEPVLDIGCGKGGKLVIYLHGLGIEAYGFDRFAFDNLFLTNSDWFEFTFGIEKWGTITSNMGFTNHFTHHHFRNDGCYIDYAKKYMDILNSLKPDGSFHYAPDLFFIEQYLDVSKYQLTSKKIGDYSFKSSIVKRLK